MTRKTFLLFIVLCGLNSSIFAQELEPGIEPARDRPLNLSLPRDVLKPSPSMGRLEDDLVARNLRSGQMEIRPGNGYRGGMPYGSGYEARQRGFTSSGQGAGGAGGAGRGRHGMGRGR